MLFQKLATLHIWVWGTSSYSSSAARVLVKHVLAGHLELSHSYISGKCVRTAFYMPVENVLGKCTDTEKSKGDRTTAGGSVSES